jgi:hypothetical protein
MAGKDSSTPRVPEAKSRFSSRGCQHVFRWNLNDYEFSESLADPSIRELSNSLVP